MSLSSKVVLSFLAATFAALLSWVVIDFNPWYHLPADGQLLTFMQQMSQAWYVGAFFGAFVGLGIGYVNGLSAGSGELMKRYLLWGVIVGFFGGIVGLFVGQMIFGPLYIDPRQSSPYWTAMGAGNQGGAAAAKGAYAFGRFIWDIFIRAIGWSMIGLFLGLAQGFPSRSKRAARHGAIGGFIGGLIGGTLFEIVPYILPPGTKDPSVMSRGISLTVTGASIGFFIGLVETLLKQAWIRVVEGRNEGREYVISKPRTAIGRDELADVGLFGDRNIAPTHAVIDMQNGRHILRDTGSAIGTALNGQKVTEGMLKDGDIIQIGSMQLEFHEKATAGIVPRHTDVASKPMPPIPNVKGVCPFCGGIKDPRTGACECSVGSAAPGGVNGMQMPPLQDATVAAPTAVPSAGSGPRLTGISGPYAGQSYQLSPGGEMTVGREPGRDIQLMADTTVSRRHARVANEGGSFVVYDEGSSNGTTVNGARVTRQILTTGDTVAFGTSAFRFDQ